MEVASGRLHAGQGPVWGGAVGSVPTDCGNNGSKKSIVTDGEGGPLAAIVAPANVNCEAQVLEETIHCGYGFQLTPEQWQPVTLEYIRAALFCWATGDEPAVRQMLSYVISNPSSVCDSEELIIEHLMHRASDQYPEVNYAKYFEAVFLDLFRNALKPRALLTRLFSRLHMTNVFQAAGRSDWEMSNRHIWMGLWHNLRWLLNYGVIVIAEITGGWKYYERQGQQLSLAKLILPL